MVKKAQRLLRRSLWSADAPLLWCPAAKDSKGGKGGGGQDCPAKTALARELVAALPDRRISVADAAYRGKPLHGMPANVRFVPG